MPSLLHEGLLEMVRERPVLVAELLSGPLGIKVPPFQTAQLSLNDLTEATPTELRADQVITLHDGGGEPTLAVVLEVQLKPIERKRQTWPAYFATTHSRLKCPVALLVFCPTEAVADWVADPIRIGDPGMVLTAIALGPSQIPKVTTLEQAETYPELAIMSVLAHGNGSDPEPVLSVLPAVLNKFDLEHAQLYARLVAGALRAAAQACLEEIMTTAAGQDEKFLGELLFPTTFARGRAEGKVQAVLGILAARGVSVSDEVHARITACTDDEELDRWVHRAVVADRAEDLFA